MKGFNANKTELIEGKTFSDCSQKSLVKKRITGKNYFIILIFLEKKKAKQGRSNKPILFCKNQYKLEEHQWIYMSKSVYNCTAKTRPAHYYSNKAGNRGD